MRLAAFTNPHAWDVVRIDDRGRPIGLSRTLGHHVVSLYYDVDACVWWWSIIASPSHGGGEVNRGTSDSLPHAASAAYLACVGHGVIATAGTTCRPDEPVGREVSRTDDG